jgi:hypothetical protein
MVSPLGGGAAAVAGNITVTTMAAPSLAGFVTPLAIASVCVKEFAAAPAKVQPASAVSVTTA